MILHKYKTFEGKFLFQNPVSDIIQKCIRSETRN